MPAKCQLFNIEKLVQLSRETVKGVPWSLNISCGMQYFKKSSKTKNLATVPACRVGIALALTLHEEVRSYDKFVTLHTLGAAPDVRCYNFKRLFRNEGSR